MSLTGKHIMPSKSQLLSFITVSALIIGALGSTSYALGVRANPAIENYCGLPAGWSVPGDGALLDDAALIAQLSKQSAVLLGERHDRLDHHRWQLDVLRALHVTQPDIALALEMFPRRVQPALDAWVGGELSEAEFLKQSEWQTVWGFDPELYMDIFRYARDHGIPMRAVNVDSGLTRLVGREGFDAVPEEAREGVSRPAEPSAAYAKWLSDVYRMHLTGNRVGDHSGRHLRHFIEAQLLWDRAMAEGIRDTLLESPGRLVVALIGSGHLRHGHGVPHQLADLGISAQATLLPWDADFDCNELVVGLADAVYNLRDFGTHGPALDV